MLFLHCNVLFLLYLSVCNAMPDMDGDPCACPHAMGATKKFDCTAWNELRSDESQQWAIKSNGGDAKQKADALWAQVVANKAKAGYMNPLKTIYYANNLTYISQMQSIHGDQRPASHRKITHGVGGVARAHFKWYGGSPYTGMFQHADQCIVRMANAAQPDGFATSWNPNLAIKCLRDASEAANLQAIWEIDGYNVIPKGKASSCSLFEVPLANHCGNRDNISMPLKDMFIGPFQKVDPHSMQLGTSQMALFNQDGSRVEKPVFPYALVYQPHPSLNSVNCDYHDYTKQLVSINQGGLPYLYRVYAVRDPWVKRPLGKPDLQPIGELRLDTNFTSSFFGDTALFFRHTFFKTELTVLKAFDARRATVWNTYADEHFKEEGAAWYAPFLPSNCNAL